VLYDGSTLPDPLNPADKLLLQNGATYGAGLSLNRLVSKVDSIGISMNYTGNVTSSGDYSSTYTLHGTWGRPLGQRMSIAAAGGLDTYRVPQATGFALVPTGSVIVTRSTTHGSFSFGVDKGVEVSGTGTHISTSFNPGWNIAIGRRLAVSMNGRIVHNTFTLDPNFTYNGVLGGVSAGYRLAGNLMASANYSYWRRQTVNLPATETNNTTFNVSYGKSWR
jgi:hypothetical protein